MLFSPAWGTVRQNESRQALSTNCPVPSLNGSVVRPITMQAITVQGCRVYGNIEVRRCCTMIPPVQRFAYRRYLQHVYAVNW